MDQLPSIVKQEPVDPVHLENTILRLCRENPKGITDSLLQSECPGISVEQRMKALQRLLSMVIYIYISDGIAVLLFYKMCIIRMEINLHLYQPMLSWWHKVPFNAT